MQIITMLRLTLDGKPMHATDNDPDPRDWWCVIETKEEEMVYDKAFHEPYNPESAKQSLVKGLYIDLWNEMINHAGLGTGVSWGEDDIYGYIRPDEVVPEIGDKYVDGDGDTWKRIE